MTDESLDPLLDLSKGKRRPKGEGFRITLAERIRAARRLPQAVVKVTSFSHGLTQVAAHFRYITRAGALPLEKDTGEVLTDREKQAELAQEWGIDFDERKRWDTANIVFSMPKGSGVEALRRAVRVTGAKAFPNHEWAFAIHEDRDHPHAHMMVKMRDRDGAKKLRLRKGDLFQLRQVFAEAAREQGVRLAASPRAARGVGRKGLSQALHHLRKKGIVPNVEKSAAKEALRDLREGTRKTLPWETAMAERHQKEREEYLREAAALRTKAESQEETERAKFLRAAADLERFAKTMPTPKTRRQTLTEKTKSTRERDFEIEKTRPKSPGMDLER